MKMKKFLSVLLAVVMIVTMLPTQIFAVPNSDDGIATITIGNNWGGSSYSGKYVTVSDGSSYAVYLVASDGKLQTMGGATAKFAAGTYTVYYGMSRQGYYKASVTVKDSDTNAKGSLSNANWSSLSSTEKYYVGESIYYNTEKFDHVDIRVAGSVVIDKDGHSSTATVSNPKLTVKVDGKTVATSSNWNNNTSYEWRKTDLSLSRSSKIEVHLTLDLTYTGADGKKHVMEGVEIVYDNVNNHSKFVQAIVDCDAQQGLDFVVTAEDIAKEIQYYSVTYGWKVYNTDGTYTDLPAGAPSLPASTSGHEENSNYVYNTTFVEGTAFADYENGLLYTFHGWDTYSHSAQFNVDPTAAGYHALDDGDADASNNPTIAITADTYIYGYWTVMELDPASAYITLEKTIYIDGKEVTDSPVSLWFRIDTGVDKDGDGDTHLDVDYGMIKNANGTFPISVYQYKTPFTFEEMNADLPGYTRSTTATVSGDYVTASSVSGTTVIAKMDPVYQGENVHLGTVHYVNRYTKNVGTPVSEYPVLNIIKSAVDTGAAQEGVTFTLYSDAACTNALTTVTTGAGGLTQLNFGAISGISAGTYYLKETGAIEGYRVDSHVFPITLTVASSAEELRGNEYVRVTRYSLSVSVPDDCDAAYQQGTGSDVYYRLHVYDDPIVGSLNLRKTITGMASADQSNLNAVVIVHGPITRDNDGAISSVGNTWQLSLNSENGFAASLSGLTIGEYLIHESYASVHGYTWTGVTYGDLNTTVYNDITSGIFFVRDDSAINLTLTNTYEEWTAANFAIRKVSSDGTALAGAVFQLYLDEACTVPATGEFTTTATSGADGYARFSGFKIADARSTSVTYYLKETKAPAGYYLSANVYAVTIEAVTSGGKTAYNASIELVSGSDGANISGNFMTVTNYPVKGKITVTKNFADGVIPEGMGEVTVHVSGSDVTRIVKLNAANGWSVVVDDLPLGTYTITEANANVPGYTWSVAYSSTTVTLTEENPGYSTTSVVPAGTVTVTNSYTRNELTYENPTSLTVRKVDEDGETPLAGAQFTLTRMDASGKEVMSTTTYTTGETGIVVFELLSGFIEDGQDIDGTYILTETAAPEGYVPITTSWTITVKEDDGKVRVELNEDKNIFENIWDWIIGTVTPGTYEDGVLTVRNTKMRGSLTIEKAVDDELNRYADAEYSFTLDCSDDAFDRTFTLKAGKKLTIEDIPYGTTYTLTENTTGAAFTGTIEDAGEGLISMENTIITVTNTYAYTTHMDPLTLVKVDADENAKVIAGAGFTLFTDEALTKAQGSEVFSDAYGKVVLPITEEGTYYLAETTTPEGYHPNENVYVVTAEKDYVVCNAGTAQACTDIRMNIQIEGFTAGNDGAYRIENTAIKSVSVSVKKVWEDEGYYARPESVEVVLYRDGVEFDSVILNKENDWRYRWNDLTDEYTWSVDEVEVPCEYTKSVENDGDAWTITNTRQVKKLELSVTKAWKHNGGKDLPESISVTLFRDDEAFETIKLSDANNWTYTWKDLPDVYRWRVDETDVPAGYTKEIEVDGFDFVITNTRTINPVEITVNKVWVSSEGVTHPDSVVMVLYRDGKKYDSVKLSDANNWTHTWKDLTDEYTWYVDEPTVPEGYTKNVTVKDNVWTIANVKNYKNIEVSVQKIWHCGENESHPDSVEVVLYRDGKKFDTVKLSAANNWSYTWKDLTDEFQWSVDEASVPSGYTKTVRNNGYSYTITNTHESIPKTGDSGTVFTVVMIGICVLGFGLCTAALLVPAKQKRSAR